MNIEKKFLKILLTSMMTLFMSFTTAIPYVNAAGIVPKLQMVTPAVAEYYPGDRVSFTVASPNYRGKVEYRVILYNGTTKKTSELWPNMPEYYYKNWQPAGNYNFTINWPVAGMEPGAYSLTVLVRRVGTKVAYDSFVKTSTFWIKNEDTDSTADQEETLDEITEEVVDAQETDDPVNIINSGVFPDPIPSDDVPLYRIVELSDDYYENQLGKYKIKLPLDSYHIEKNQDEIAYAIVSSFTDSYIFTTIISAPIYKDISLDMAKELLFNNYIKEISMGNDSWKEISSKKVKVSNTEAYLCEYSENREYDGVVVQFRYYILFMINNDRCYLLTTVTNAKDNESNKTLIEQSLMSLVPLD